ncbi:hypothetical protein HDZ31DRAFT_64460 [Schizophyllum fasciatum]
MKLGLLALLLAPLAAALAKAAPPAAAAHEQLAALAAAGDGIIRLDDKTYDLLTAPQRNWSATVLFTAMDKRRRCGPCREFDPSWNAVAKSWKSVPAEQRDEHFFGVIDFDENPATFTKLKMASAPAVHVYLPTTGPRGTSRSAPISYDFSQGFEPAPLAAQLSRHTPVPIPYQDPFDWGKLFQTIATLFFGALALRWAGPVLANRWVWAAGAIGTSLVMTGGYMFTKIRNVPYTGPDGGWIAGGYQNQFGQEVQVVAFLYGFLAFSFVMLINVVPLQKSAARQTTQIYIWTAVIFILYSLLFSLFRVKNRGYPFKLLL